MKTIQVSSQQFNTLTFERIGQMRTETIDITTNTLFQECRTIMDVRRVYESFWNNLGKNQNTNIKVLVKNIEIIEK